MSLPTDAKPIPAASEAPAPALEPPGLASVRQGFRTMPKAELTPDASSPKSGIVVFASVTAPASSSRAAGGASKLDGGRSRFAAVPCSHGQPRLWMLSLIVTGTPSSGPSGRPRRHRSSDALALASASSRRIDQSALSTGFARSTRSAVARTTSTGDTSRDRYARLRSAIDKFNNSRMIKLRPTMWA